MSLLPYALRPRVVLRGQIIKRGVIGGNPFLRAIAMLLVGQGVYLRRTALRQGLILGHPFWRLIGALLLGEAVYKQAFKRAPETIAVERIGIDHHVRVAVMKPSLKRRGRRAMLQRLEAEAWADIEAAKRAS